MNEISELTDLNPNELLVKVTITQVKGSAPRNEGTSMWVSNNRFWGTIGGGHLEWQILETAREWLLKTISLANKALSSDQGQYTTSQTQVFILGANLGQCCGGKVKVQMDLLTAEHALDYKMQLEQSYEKVCIFGAGHVGLALVRQLLLLPYKVECKDSRELQYWQTDLFLQKKTKQLSYEQVSPIAEAVPDLTPGTKVLILTHSHVEDFEIIKACLARQTKYADLPWIGLIGSATKWARFSTRLLALGFSQELIDQVQSPIGMKIVKGKEPAVIALSVVADWLSKPSPTKQLDFNS